VPSGSCAGMLRHGYEELFLEDPHWLARARALSKRTFEFSEFLVDHLGLQVAPVRNQGAVVYHPSCHLTRGLGISDQPRELLQSALPGSVRILDTECCGFGGVFAIDHPELSSEMLGRTIQRISLNEADFVIGCDVSCLMHIEGGLRKCGSSTRCAHLAQVLADEDLGLR
jgi:L-lactate dehydrogenase complex protein LldE